MNILELINFVESNVKTPQDQLNALAALQDAPDDEFQAKIRLPVQNEIPAFRVGDAGVGSVLKEQNYGVPAPVPGKVTPSELSIGELLIGEKNG